MVCPDLHTFDMNAVGTAIPIDERVVLCVTIQYKKKLSKNTLNLSSPVMYRVRQLQN